MANINPSIFKAYDIRGIYPTQLDEEGVDRLARGIYTFFKEKLGKEKFTVLISRDMRTHGPVMFEAVKKAFVSMGAEVIDGGVIPTPTFYFAVSHYGYDAGVQVTASHNPKEWTGLKFVTNSPNGLIKIGKPTGLEDIKTMVLGNQQFPDAEKPGTIIQKTDIVQDEITFWKEKLDNPQLDTFTIVADPGNAMGGIYIEAFTKAYNQNLIKMNFELDGTFPNHQPDPMQAKNLVDLQARVTKEHADIGLAPDGDGDRLFIVDETGTVVPASIISSLIARELLRKHPTETIVVDIRYLLTAKKIVEENGGKFADVRVGHAFITQKLQQTGGIFAGESSAHYYWRYTGGCEAQIPVIMLVLKVMSEEKKKLSDIVKELTRAYESGEFNFKVSNSQEIMEHIKEKYKDGVLTSVDCIEIAYPDWRFSIRTSNTEPLLRLNVEAYDKSKMESKRDELINEIKNVAHEVEGEGH